MKLTTETWTIVVRSSDAKRRILRDLPVTHPDDRDEIVRVILLQADAKSLDSIEDMLERERKRRTRQPVGRGIVHWVSSGQPMPGQSVL